MYYYVKIFSKLLIVATVVSTLSAKDIELRGKLIKVYNDGISEKFNNQKICLKGKAICTQTYSKGVFSFKKINKYLKKGEQIELEISDKNWFMLSPFKGIYHVPNKSEKLEIIMISKHSSIYLTLFTKVSHYAIQVAHLNDEQKAINLINRLKHDCLYRHPTLLPNRLKNPCWRRYKKKNNQKSCLERQKLSYCGNDNIYYQAILRNNKPHNGFSYNVFFGRYSINEYKQARNDLLFIRKKYRLEKNIWINSINTIIEDR